MSSRVLALLRLHAIRRIKVFSGISDELRVAWMIDGFHSDYHVHQLRTVVMNVLNLSVFALAGPVMRTALASEIDAATA
jgi:hypothetical protein